MFMWGQDLSVKRGGVVTPLSLRREGRALEDRPYFVLAFVFAVGITLMVSPNSRWPVQSNNLNDVTRSHPHGTLLFYLVQELRCGGG